MKVFFIVILSFFILSCNNEPKNEKDNISELSNKLKESINKNEVLEKRIAILEKKLDDAYKPGLGEFMSAIQHHHAKLWFAGKNKNWKLAEYEINELDETIEDISKNLKERQEIKMISILNNPIIDIKKAILNKDYNNFEKNFNDLTKNCNSCHIANKFEFNVIIVPKSNTFLNQDFNVKNN